MQAAAQKYPGLRPGPIVQAITGKDHTKTSNLPTSSAISKTLIEPIIVLRLPVLMVQTGLKRSSVYSKMNPRSKYFDSTFPTPIRTGSRSIGWIESEVNAWLESRIKLSRIGQQLGGGK